MVPCSAHDGATSNTQIHRPRELPHAFPSPISVVPADIAETADAAFARSITAISAVQSNLNHLEIGLGVELLVLILIG